METNFEEKTFFKPGDIVTLRQDIPNKPKMVVVRKEITIFKDSYQNAQLRGIRCRWFSDGGVLQEAIWNTKDLIRI